MTHSSPLSTKDAATVLSDTKEGVTISAKEHAKILRKMDWHILPPVSVLYLFSFLDRANIGNARIAGMAEDLNLIGLRYNIAVAIFFIPYCLAQVPSNIIQKFIRSSRWLPAIMVAWGLTMTLMCLVKTYQGLLIARVFLGLAESGLFPGVAFYLTTWYTRAERARRIALFLSAAIMAAAFSGLLAFSIEKMDGICGLHGWQWIFCLEGIATVLIALAAPFFIYDNIEGASFLTEAERRHIAEWLDADSQGLATHYSSEFVLQALKDYKIYIQFGVYIGLTIPAYGIAFFLPTIINELGFSASNAQLLTIPPFTAGCVATILAGTYSDKYRLRGPYVIVGALITLIGFIVLYTQTSPGPAYVGTMLAAIGIYPTLPIIIAWVSSNAGGEVKRNVALAMTNGFGSLGGICASFVFFDPPRYHTGVTIIMTLLVLLMLLACLAIWDFNRLNKQKLRVCHERGILDDQKEEFRENGDDSPLFEYTL